MTVPERDLFRLLVNNVSGIGPKMALAVLSGMSVANFKNAVVANDIAALSKISGVGKKTAERVVLELRDKLGVAATWEAASSAHAPSAGGNGGQRRRAGAHFPGLQAGGRPQGDQADLQTRRRGAQAGGPRAAGVEDSGAEHGGIPWACDRPSSARFRRAANLGLPATRLPYDGCALPLHDHHSPAGQRPGAGPARCATAFPAEGLFAEKEWLLSPRAFALSDGFVDELEKLGYRLHLFQRACNLLYQLSVKGKQPAWVAAYLDAGKPPELVALSRERIFRDEIAARHPAGHHPDGKRVHHRRTRQRARRHRADGVVQPDVRRRWATTWWAARTG